MADGQAQLLHDGMYSTHHLHFIEWTSIHDIHNQHYYIFVRKQRRCADRTNIYRRYTVASFQ